MASKEAKADATTEAAAAAAPVFAFEFKLLKDKIGEKTTNKQVKAKVNEAFLGYGAFDECRVAGDAGADRVVTVFFARLFGKGQPAWDTLTRGEEASVTLYDETVPLRKSDAKPSGGGATTGTSFRPKKEAPKGEKKGGRRPPAGGEAKDGKDGKPAAAGAGAGAGDAKDAKDGKDGKDRKDGGRGRGRGKKEEVKGPSLQRGRANIGGKLGPVSKVRLAKAAKDAKEKEAKERAARGEKPLEEETKEDEKTDGLPPPRKTDEGKKESGKKGDAKKEGGKKEAGKAEGGKKEGGKKEAGKAEGKKEAGKKGK